MKKIVALGVLLVLLSTAIAFAQDEGSGWKVGFYAQLTRDIFYSIKASGEGEDTYKQVAPGFTVDDKASYTLGEYIKGSRNLFTKTDGHRPDNRLLISLSNSGEHHSVYIDMKLDDSWVNGFTFMNLLSGGAADWSFSGDTGGLDDSFVVFDGKVGTGRYGGLVPAYEIWDDWIQEGGMNFFGVHEMGGFIPSNNISASAIDGNVWQTVYAVGATFKDTIRLAVGSTLGSFAKGSDDPLASASNVQAGFMLSGKGIADMISFDIFYAINGEDNNTLMRGFYDEVADDYTVGGLWNNLLGFYVGVDLDKVVKGLGASLGYTLHFVKYEPFEVKDNNIGVTDPFKTLSFDVKAPAYSGIDLKLNFGGIEKLGVTLNNNVSFASVEMGAENEFFDHVRVLGLDGKPFTYAYNTPVAGTTWSDEGTQKWFAYDVKFKVSYSLTDHLGIALALVNQLGVFTESTESKVTYTGGSNTTTDTTKVRSDNFAASLHAEYSVGNVTFGLGLNLGIAGATVTSESENVVTSGAGTTTTTENSTASLKTVSFGVPLFFKVAF